MEILIPLLAVLLIFGFIPATMLVRSWLAMNERLEAKKLLGTGDQAKLLAIAEENARLRSRVETLETIVTSVETDLNKRFERLMFDTQSSLSRMAALESASSSRQLTALTEALPDLGSRYKLVEEIGRGGMGTVYRAQDLKLNETVALKVLPPNIGAEHRAVERFTHEASASRRITHPNVIRIHDLGEERNRLYISMEYFPSLSLKQLMRRDAPLGLPRILHIGRQIVDGLAAAHLQGVIHRDLKPQNILVGRNDLCKIIDFGLARSNLMLGLTATGAVVGTPEYMSPEQVRGAEITEASDLYSLGIVLYEMLAGEPPFRGDNPIAVGFRHLQDAPPPLPNAAALPQPLVALVERLLQKKPEARFASAKDVAAIWSELRAA